MLLIVLLCTLVTGCAVMAYHYFSRYIPYYGIIDGDSNLRMYSCDEPFMVGDLKVESVIYVKSTDSGQLMLWAECEGITQDDIMDYIMSGNPFISIRVGNQNFSLRLTGTAGTLINVEGNCFFDNNTVTLVRGGSEKAITLEDISYKGYEVTEWPVINGITIRILPIYTNNRILVVDAKGESTSEQTQITASFIVYDSLGNKTRASYMYNDNDNLIAQCDMKLPGNIVKIEIETMRIRNYYDDTEFAVPISPTDSTTKVNIPLIDTNICDETLVEIKREGEYLYLTTKLTNDKNCPDNTTTGDFMTDYNSNIMMEYYNMQGLDTVIYKFKLTDNFETLILSPVSSVYMISGHDAPLGTIEIKKAN